MQNIMEEHQYIPNFSIPVTETVNVTYRLEIVDINATHIKYLSYMKVESSSGSKIYQNTTWVKKNSMTSTEAELIKNYEDTIYIEGIGTRDVTVYEYRYKDGSMLTLYYDKKAGWPVEIKYTFTSGDELVLTLTKTNVPGLKP